MAPSTKQQQPPAANPTPSAVHPHHSNGVITNTSSTPGGTVNRKKAKRRQKQAARQAASQDKQAEAEYASDDLDDPRLAQPQDYGPPPPPAIRSHDTYADPYVSGPDQYDGMDGDDLAYSDEDGYTYDPAYSNPDGIAPQYAIDTGRAKSRSKRKKKSRSSRTDLEFDEAPFAPEHYHPSSYSYPPGTYPRDHHLSRPPNHHAAISEDALRTVQRGISKDPIWDTSSHEEKAKIKEFWLSLSEKERKSLVKIEKEAVLRKMKEQQKNSCSCTVCGRKRTAIEEELEVLYDAYYQELEQEKSMRGSETAGRLPSEQLPPGQHLPRHSRSRIQELHDDEEDDLDGDEDDYSLDEFDDDDYSADEYGMLHNNSAAGDFLAFGNSLTVQGGILTVAEELLRNDGQKFIDMMEQLAERRLQREEEASRAPYDPARHAQIPQHYPAHADDAEFQDEEEEYDSEEDYEEEEEEDEMDTMTEHQRMEEGRRMFQIFAARMFEQRVLTAYREKVARERQNKLIEEFEAEQDASNLRATKKQRDAEKKKAKKQQQKHAKAEEKAKKEQQKAAEEAAAREAEAKRQEEQKRKREEQRKKREAERKAQEEEKQRKEAEKHRRQQEERERQQEQERRQREAKAEEKRRREEARKREREEREAREQASREKKLQEERLRREKEEKAQAENEAQGRVRRDEESSRASQSSPASDNARKPSTLSNIVALPPGLKPQKSTTGQPQPSPSRAATTPVIPKAPTPMRGHNASSQNSQPSAPDTPETAPIQKQATPPRLSTEQSQPPQQNTVAARTPGRQPSRSHVPPVSPMHSLGPPPGMHQPPNIPFSNMSPGTMNGLPRASNPMLQGIPPGMQPGRQMPIYQQGPHVGFQHQAYSHLPHTGPPAGVNPPGMPGRGPGHETGPFHQAPPHAAPGHVPQTYAPAQEPRSAHSRQPSSSFDPTQIESQHPAQPIARPQPIKRPASTRPHESDQENRPSRIDTDVDDISRGLGSKALLDDSDEPLPSAHENRRPSAAPGMPAGPSGVFGSPFEQKPPTFGAPGRNSGSGGWGVPAPFGQPGFTGWGASAAGGWGSHGGFRYPAHRSNNPRPIVVRMLACQACQHLSSVKGGAGGGFHEMSEVLRQADALKPAQESAIEPRELREILETEGDGHNGGGSFLVSNQGPNRMLVRWEQDPGGASSNIRGPAPGLGQIGGSIPGSTIGRGF